MIIMRILHIIASVDPAGGGPIEGILRQDEACRAAGLDVSREILTLDPPDSPHLTSTRLKVHALGRRKDNSLLPWRRALEHYRYSPEFSPWLRAHISEYDLAIVNGLWNYATLGSASVLSRKATPYLSLIHI